MWGSWAGAICPFTCHQHPSASHLPESCGNPSLVGDVPCPLLSSLYRLVLWHLVSGWPQKGQSLGSQAVVILWGHLINVPSRWGLCLSCSLSASGIGTRSLTDSLIHLFVHSFIPRVLIESLPCAWASHCQSEEAAPLLFRRHR